MAAKKNTTPAAAQAQNPKAVAPPPPTAAPPAEGELMRGTFCDLAKYGGTGWGLKVEEDGDIAPGQQIKVKKRDEGFKTVTIDEVLYEDSYKVVCTFIPDPDDKPANGRKGTVRKGSPDMGSDAEGRGSKQGRGSEPGDLDISGGEGRANRYADDIRGLRTGRVRFGGESANLGGVRIATGRLNYERLLDGEAFED